MENAARLFLHRRCNLPLDDDDDACPSRSPARPRPLPYIQPPPMSSPLPTEGSRSSPFQSSISSLASDPRMIDDDLQDRLVKFPGPHPFDWFQNSHQSSLYLSEQTCEIVCYLWFSSNSPSSHRHHFVPHSSPHTASPQFSVSLHFIQFMQKVLETTQVSQSVLTSWEQFTLTVWQLFHHPDFCKSSLSSAPMNNLTLFVGGSVLRRQFRLRHRSPLRSPVISERTICSPLPLLHNPPRPQSI